MDQAVNDLEIPPATEIPASCHFGFALHTDVGG